jgi:hypothetical protein
MLDKKIQIEAMLTELNIIPVSSNQSRNETRKGLAGTFVPVNNPAKA